MAGIDKYAALRELALANFETLLRYWNVEYIKATNDEYDFLSPTRKNDSNFGACRFNASKGFGADFAGTNITEKDCANFGPGFTKEDFASFTSQGQTKSGFDIIGLCQRIYNRDTYKEAAELLNTQLDYISKNGVLIKITQEDVDRREQLRQENKLKVRNFAEKGWNLSKPIKGTIAENYFLSRNININYQEPNIRFHPRVFNKELKIEIPTIVFRVQDQPLGRFMGIHRIYIAKDGSRKAHVANPKMALASVHGGAIWFGIPSDKLYILEGPEEALHFRYSIGKDFVISTLFANNFHNIKIPDFVATVVLCPDDDESGAGQDAVLKAISTYEKQGKKVKMILHRGMVFNGKK